MKNFKVEIKVRELEKKLRDAKTKEEFLRSQNNNFARELDEVEEMFSLWRDEIQNELHRLANDLGLIEIPF